MTYRNKTIRQMPGPDTRKLARLINDLDSTLRKLKNILPDIQSIEIDSIALYKRLSTFEKKVFLQEKVSRELEQLPLESHLDNADIDHIFSSQQVLESTPPTEIPHIDDIPPIGSTKDNSQ